MEESHDKLVSEHSALAEFERQKQEIDALLADSLDMIKMSQDFNNQLEIKYNHPREGRPSQTKHLQNDHRRGASSREKPNLFSDLKEGIQTSDTTTEGASSIIMDSPIFHREVEDPIVAKYKKKVIELEEENKSLREALRSIKSAGSGDNVIPMVCCDDLVSAIYSAFHSNASIRPSLISNFGELGKCIEEAKAFLYQNVASKDERIRELEEMRVESQRFMNNGALSHETKEFLEKILSHITHLESQISDQMERGH